MTYDQRRRVACPHCEGGEVAQIHPFLTRCGECGGTISYDFFKTLRQIANLPDAGRDHPCECDHSETRGSPEGAYRRRPRFEKTEEANDE